VALALDSVLVSGTSLAGHIRCVGLVVSQE
jgi:hypothetical protein